MWITAKGLCQEKVVDPHTGLLKVVSVKVSGTGKKAEQDAYKRLEKKIADLGNVKVKLSELIELYQKEQERDTKPSTQRKVYFELKAFFEIYGECYIDTINAGAVRQKLLASGKSNRTLNGYLKHFKAMWRWAYRNDYVKSPEVADKLQNFSDTPEKERIQDKYLETNELSALLDAMTETRWKLLTEFLTLSGMRIGEVIALDNTDVWGKNIRVTKTYDSNNNISTTPKTISSKREVYIQAELKECIAHIHEYCQNQSEVFNYTSDIFFPDTNGGRLSYYAYAKYLKETAERVLDKRVTPHVLRHTHCSMLAASGFPLEAISARLGHEDSHITKAIYLHRMEELKEKENKQLDSFSLIKKSV